MNSAPLPQPSPHTCPNCGASLTTLPALCPQCRTMVHEFRSSIKRRRHLSLRDYIIALAVMLVWMLLSCVLVLMLVGQSNILDVGTTRLGIFLFVIVIVLPVVLFLLITRRSIPK